MSERGVPIDHNPEALAYAIRKAGFSQREFADILGKAPSTVSEIIKGTRNLTPPDLLRAAEILNCPASVLERNRHEPNDAVFTPRTSAAIREHDVTVRVDPEDRTVSVVVVHREPVGLPGGEQLDDLVLKGLYLRGGQIADHGTADGDQASSCTHCSSSPVVEGAATPDDATVVEGAAGSPSTLPDGLPDSGTYSGTVMGFTTGEFNADGEWLDYPSPRVFIQLDDPEQGVRHCRAVVFEIGPNDPDPAVTA